MQKSDIMNLAQFFHQINFKDPNIKYTKFQLHVIRILINGTPLRIQMGRLFTKSLFVAPADVIGQGCAGGDVGQLMGDMMRI